MKSGHSEMTREQLVRTGHLLYMRYTPSELAKEIGCNVDTIYRSYVPAGCPHERDERGHLWIVGTAFRDWAYATFSRKGAKMPEGFAYCLRCRRPAEIVSPSEKPINRYLSRVKGKCANCGASVNRTKKR
jgi:hypothetical protein